MINTNCAHCDKPITQPATGRKRKYCGDTCKDAYHNATKNPIHNAVRNAARTAASRAKSEDKANSRAMELSASLLAEYQAYDDKKKVLMLDQIISGIAFGVINVLSLNRYTKSEIRKALTFYGTKAVRSSSLSNSERFAQILNNHCKEKYGFTVSKLFTASNDESAETIYEYRIAIGENKMYSKNSRKNRTLEFDDDKPGFVDRPLPDGFLATYAKVVAEYGKTHRDYHEARQWLIDNYNFDCEEFGYKYSLDVVMDCENNGKVPQPEAPAPIEPKFVFVNETLQITTEPLTFKEFCIQHRFPNYLRSKIIDRAETMLDWRVQ